ncbi:MAG: hypothetical protein ABRQ23_05895 [Syntrophomonadaceae bacterium]
MAGRILTLGGMSIDQRETWVETIFNRVKTLLEEFADLGITTCSSLCATTLKNSYVRGRVFPFINIPIRYNEQELLGLYEYFGDQLPLDADNIYCDVVIQSIYYAEHLSGEELLNLEARAKALFAARHWEVVQFDGGMATLKLERTLLDNQVFEDKLRDILTQAIEMQAEMR